MSDINDKMRRARRIEEKRRYDKHRRRGKVRRQLVPKNAEGDTECDFF
jgi:hypothetical protein